MLDSWLVSRWLVECWVYLDKVYMIYTLVECYQHATVQSSVTIVTDTELQLYATYFYYILNFSSLNHNYLLLKHKKDLWKARNQMGFGFWFMTEVSICVLHLSLIFIINNVVFCIAYKKMLPWCFPGSVYSLRLKCRKIFLEKRKWTKMFSVKSVRGRAATILGVLLLSILLI